MKQFFVIPAQPAFKVELICSIDFGSAIGAFCLLMYIAISMYFSLKYR